MVAFWPILATWGCSAHVLLGRAASIASIQGFTSSGENTRSFSLQCPEASITHSDQTPKTNPEEASGHTSVLEALVTCLLFSTGDILVAVCPGGVPEIVGPEYLLLAIRSLWVLVQAVQRYKYIVAGGLGATSPSKPVLHSGHMPP